MSRIGKLCLLCPMLLLGSIILSGCTTDETKLEPTMPKSVPSPDMLTVGLKALDSSESQKNNTSLIFFISNETEADKTLLIWNTPVEQPLSADIFSVELNGVNLSYQGRLVKRGSPLPEHFRSVAASETIETVIDLANNYDMSASGSYNVSLDPAMIDGTHQLNDQTPIQFAPEIVILTVP